MANAIKQIRIGVVAPSAKLPRSEFQLGIERIQDSGFHVQIHPQCYRSEWYFAGADEERAKAFFEYASNPKLDVIWYARGGYGAGRILKILDEMTRKKGVPSRKLLVGYSDATAMLEYVRTRWGWHTLHAPMPGLRQFCKLPEKEWKPLVTLVRGEALANPWAIRGLKFHGPKPKKTLRGEAVGGNLTVWTSLIGTPHAINAKGKIAFFEDTDEAMYRIDRMVNQLLHSESLKGAKAIVLGNFMNCRDSVGSVLKKLPAKGDPERYRIIHSPNPEELEPLRKTLNEKKGILEIFGRAANELGIPLAYGLPAGHGPEKAPVPLGAKYVLEPSGRFEIESWSWWK